MTFSQWKQSYQRDRICRTNHELQYWMEQHGVQPYDWDRIRDNIWVCTGKAPNVLLSVIRLELTIRGLPSTYKQPVYSFEGPRNIIHEEYFKMYGNLCRIQEYHVRIMEYPGRDYTLQRRTIFAHVKPLWREERASHTIDRFLWNCCHPPLLTLKKRPRTQSLSPRTEQELCSKTELTQWYSETYHSVVVNYFVKDKPRHVPSPRLVLIVGLPGSGKNWALEKKREKGHVHVNMDDIRALLPKYWKGMITLHADNVDWIQYMAQECKAIANKLFQYALSHQMNIVWNGTGKNLPKYERLLSSAQRRGYITELRYIWVPLELAKQRVRQRAETIGRFVPDQVINLADKQIPQTFKALYVHVDHARIYSNEEHSPTMIWDKEQGWSCTPRRRKSISEQM